MVLAPERGRSLRDAAGVGIGVGLGALALFVASGLLLAEWSLSDFLRQLDVGVAVALVLAGGVAVACFAVPVVAYLRYRLVSPLALLVAILVGWPVYGAAIGLLNAQTVFGLAVYALYLAPVYLLLYAVSGGAEYSLRDPGGTERGSGDRG